jgi:hypothetical protein
MMITTAPAAVAAAPSSARRDALAACDEAADYMYHAEAALHTARQAGIDAWVRAAGLTLHDAILGHTAAVIAAAATAPGARTAAPAAA